MTKPFSLTSTTRRILRAPFVFRAPIGIIAALFAALCVFAPETSRGATSPTGPSVTGRTDQPPLSYEPGAPAVFEFSVRGFAPDRETFVKWTIIGDGGFKRSSGVAALPPGVSDFALTNTIHAPGFAMASASLATGPDGKLFRVDGQIVSCTLAAGFGTEAIRAMPEPEDFDEFWKGVRTEAESVDLSGVEILPASDTTVAAKWPGSTVFGFRVPIPGHAPATGWIAFPRDAEAGTLPAELRFRDYGVGGGSEPSPALDRSALAADVNAHGFDLGRDPAYYRDFMNRISDGGHGGGYGFRDDENAAPETCYFRDMALRALVAARYVQSLPQWNGADLAAAGAGQGAFQATALAALDRSVSALRVALPWPCDIGGTEKLGRIEGWHPVYQPALRYFDAANLASRVTATCDMEIVGLADLTAPPSGAAAYFNALRGPKKATWVQNRRHETGPVPEGVQTQTVSVASSTGSR